MIAKKSKKIFEIEISTLSKDEVRENIEKSIENGDTYCHIVSINPEILVETTISEPFKKYIQRAPIQLLDGVGVIIASKILHIPCGERYSGVDCMVDLLKYANSRALRVGLLGGKPKIAEKVIDCQQKNYPQIHFFGLEGYKNINNMTKKEEIDVEAIVMIAKPHILFVAFGSPQTELWLENHKEMLKNTVCMVVGGSFDFLSGEVSRAPKIVRRAGLEWLFRLFHQPWRIRRQLKLVVFMWKVLQQRLAQ